MSLEKKTQNQGSGIYSAVVKRRRIRRSGLLLSAAAGALPIVVWSSILLARYFTGMPVAFPQSYQVVMIAFCALISLPAALFAMQPAPPLPLIEHSLEAPDR